MPKHPRRQSFAEIVAEVGAQPAPIPAGEPAPGRTRDGRMVDPAGRSFEEVESKISAPRALELAQLGALVVWDPCGCGGYCGYEWFSPADVQGMVASGPPIIRKGKKRWGEVSAWRTDDGSTLLLAENEVRWGKRMF